jgi:hypothetical protein
MLHTLVEDGLKKIDGFDRFKLVHEAAKLARSAPIDANGKPVIWALRAIAEGRASSQNTVESEEE